MSFDIKVVMLSMDSFPPVNCQDTLGAIKLKSVNESIRKKFPQMKCQARINVEVLGPMLKYEAVHKFTEQIFTDTPTSLVPQVTLSSGLG